MIQDSDNAGFDKAKFPSFKSVELIKDILHKDGILRLRARGSSMRPLIFDNDLLEVMKIGNNRVHVGDIVVFSLDNKQLLVHRVIRMHKDDSRRRFLLQGDALLISDGWVEIGQVLGKVVAIQKCPRARAAGNWKRLDNPISRLNSFLVALFLPVIKNLYILILKIIK